MELVAASKMRRAQEQALRSRSYRDETYGLLTRLSTMSEVTRQPLFSVRPVKTRLYVVITSNSGLAGAYNANVLKMLTHQVMADRSGGIKSQVIAIGNKGAQFARRAEEMDLIAVYSSFGDSPTANDLRPILNTIVEKYLKQEIDEVRLIYTMFKSNLVQLTTQSNLMPAAVSDGHDSSDSFTNFEPDLESVLHYTGLRLIEAQLWQAVLEGLASEQSARMLAMQNATDNAGELIDEYTLEFNTARQSAITQELAEISGGVEALKD
jgi:F-type H+-transporting ATPase subunit gamma